MRFASMILTGLRGRSPRKVDRSAPKRILILNGGHVGDTVMATSLVPILRSAYPDAELGFLTSSVSLMVVRNNPEIAFTHSVDHWKLNRSKQSLVSKVIHYLKMRRTVLKEIREKDYDLSLSIYPWYPDFLFLAWQAAIPHRVGFSRSIFASFATTLADVSDDSFTPQGARLAEILRPLGISNRDMGKRKASIPASDERAMREVCSLLGVESLDQHPYRIIHMGCGVEARELPLEFWREVATDLSSRCTLLFTGSGQRECDQIAKVIGGLNNCINACGRLSWEGFVAAVRNARILYGMESMAGHLAAAVGTECVFMMTGIAGVARWRPEGDRITVFTTHVSCSPCNRPAGCPEMTCLRTIRPKDILAADKCDVVQIQSQ